MSVVLVLSLCVPVAAGAAGEKLDLVDDDAETPDGKAGDQGDEAEAESHEAPGAAAPAGPKYTADIPDADLEKRWKERPESLGSLSIGFTDMGRLINGVPFPEGERWHVVSDEKAWGTRETVDDVITAIDAVNEEFPGTTPIAVNHLSRKDGGYLRPHRSHQSGRDVDLGFYYTAAESRTFAHGRKDNLDLPRNWALIRALIVHADVQVILLDQRIQKLIYDYALGSGEDREWLDSIFKGGQAALVKHARRHRNHYHVRFYNPRAQELGRRVQPLMAAGKEEYNVTVHRIRQGDNLGKIARKYNTTAAAIKRANGMKSNFLRAGRSLTIPLTGPCTNCPMPPELALPERRLPPSTPLLASPEKSRTTGSVLFESAHRANNFLPAIRALTIPPVY